MSKFSFAVILCFLCSISFGQAATDSVPAFTKMPIPPFKMTLASDSSIFTKDMLKKKKNTIIMVFSPDCSHCEHATRDLLKDYEEFKNVQIVMITPLGYAPTKKFYTDMHIADYPGIIMGSEPSYYIGSFYEVQMFPSMFLYNKKGKFVKAFDGNTRWDDIAKDL